MYLDNHAFNNITDDRENITVKPKISSLLPWECYGMSISNN